MRNRLCKFGFFVVFALLFAGCGIHYSYLDFYKNDDPSEWIGASKKARATRNFHHALQLASRWTPKITDGLANLYIVGEGCGSCSTRLVPDGDSYQVLVRDPKNLPPLDAYLNSEKLGSLQSYEFFLLRLKPGNYSIKIGDKVENVVLTANTRFYATVTKEKFVFSTNKEVVEKYLYEDGLFKLTKLKKYNDETMKHLVGMIGK